MTDPTPPQVDAQGESGPREPHLPNLTGTVRYFISGRDSPGRGSPGCRCCEGGKHVFSYTFDEDGPEGLRDWTWRMLRSVPEGTRLRFTAALAAAPEATADAPERGAFYVCPTCHGPGVVTEQVHDTARATADVEESLSALLATFAIAWNAHDTEAMERVRSAIAWSCHGRARLMDARATADAQRLRAARNAAWPSYRDGWADGFAAGRRPDPEDQSEAAPRPEPPKPGELCPCGFGEPHLSERARVRRDIESSWPAAPRVPEPPR